MANDEMTKELERLRADVAALAATRKQDMAQTTEVVSEPAAAAPVIAQAAEGELQAAEANAQPDEDIRSQLEELGTLLHEEIRDLPTITTLAVFSLGILMGRLMR